MLQYGIACGEDLGHIANEVQAAIARAGKAPQATTVQVRADNYNQCETH